MFPSILLSAVLMLGQAEPALPGAEPGGVLAPDAAKPTALSAPAAERPSEAPAVPEPIPLPEEGAGSRLPLPAPAPLPPSSLSSETPGLKLDPVAGLQGPADAPPAAAEKPPEALELNAPYGALPAA